MHECFPPKKESVDTSIYNDKLIMFNTWVDLRAHELVHQEAGEERSKLARSTGRLGNQDVNKLVAGQSFQTTHQGTVCMATRTKWLTNQWNPNQCANKLQRHSSAIWPFFRIYSIHIFLHVAICKTALSQYVSVGLIRQPTITTTSSDSILQRHKRPAIHSWCKA